MRRACSTHGNMEMRTKIFAGKFGRHKSEDNIKMDPSGIEWKAMDEIQMIHDKD